MCLQYPTNACRKRRQRVGWRQEGHSAVRIGSNTRSETILPLWLWWVATLGQLSDPCLHGPGYREQTLKVEDRDDVHEKVKH